MSKSGLTPKENIIQFVKFLFVSVSAGIIQIGAFTLMSEVLVLPYWPSYLTALVLSVVWNFTINRRHTFKSAANVPKAMALIFLFYLVFTPLSTWLGQLAADAGINEYIVLGVTMVSNFVLEFLYCRLVVYRGSINTNELAKKQSSSSGDENNA